MNELEDWRKFQKDNPPIEPKKRNRNLSERKEKPKSHNRNLPQIEEMLERLKSLKTAKEMAQENGKEKVCFCRGGLYENEGNSTDGIMLDEEDGEFYLSYDNSAGEYARGVVIINYCPICGRKLAD